MDLKNTSVQKFMTKTYLTLTEKKDLLLQMLASIRTCHERGVLHRDIKPANFVVDSTRRVSLIDFGLSKTHLNDETGKPFPPRPVAEFRGTLQYASLSTHLRKDLGRKDDLISFFFIVCEVLGQRLPWTLSDVQGKEAVFNCKLKAFAKPEECLFPCLSEKHPEVADIFTYLEGLSYADCPDYGFLANKIAGL